VKLRLATTTTTTTTTTTRRGGLSHSRTRTTGGKIYVTGGETNQLESLNSVYVYDPQADAWTQLASMSVARQLHASAAVGGKLYVFGGRRGASGPLDTAEVYDPASDSWAQVSNLTSVRNKMVAITL